MNFEQLLNKAYQDIEAIKHQLSAQKAVGTKHKSLIQHLTTALESITNQYHDMLRITDTTIASQAKQIQELEDEVQNCYI